MVGADPSAAASSSEAPHGQPADLLRRPSGRSGQNVSPLQMAMDALCTAADRAIEVGANILILSDRGVDREHAAIPALLALAGVHHHLVRQGSRTRSGWWWNRASRARSTTSHS